DTGQESRTQTRKQTAAPPVWQTAAARPARVPGPQTSVDSSARANIRTGHRAVTRTSSKKVKESAWVHSPTRLASLCTLRKPLLVAERLDGVEPRGFPRRVV